MEWISVDDRLPEEGQEIDVYCGYRFPEAEFIHSAFNEMVLDKDGDFDHYEPMNGVTHWMPLPEPPKS